MFDYIVFVYFSNCSVKHDYYGGILKIPLCNS